MHTNSSQVDLGAPDPVADARLEGVPFRDCVLMPAEMLFIPAGWWHYVKALEPSFSLSYWWS
jgi:lysine-specific demethylase 8